MKEISLHILDLINNSLAAEATKVDLEITDSVSENVVRIKISDNGCGIENVEEARRPSFTTGEPGERCGMGFLVMESFTDSLNVKSRVGKGTTVLMRKILKP